MDYTLKDLYSTRHEATITAFKSTEFATTDAWKPVIADAKLLVVAEGFNVDKYKACESIRKLVKAGAKKRRKAGGHDADRCRRHQLADGRCKDDP